MSSDEHEEDERRNLLSNDSAGHHSHASSSSSSSLSSIGDQSLRLLRWLFSAQPIIHNPDIDTRKFIGDFERRFRGSSSTTNSSNSNSNVGNLFYDYSYPSAVRHAFQCSKTLLVYLHSDLHELTDSFCRTVLTSESVSRYLGEHFVVWGGSVADTEAFALTYQLKVKSFPFLCVLICQSETLVQIVDTIQGKNSSANSEQLSYYVCELGSITERALLDRLQQGQMNYGSVITEIRQSATRRFELIPTLLFF